MLSTALPILKQDVYKILKDDSVAECFTKALLTTFPASVNNDPDCMEIADNFGKVAAQYLAGTLTSPLCDAIDKYIKEIGIQIVPKKLTSPLGPVSGVISPEEVKIL